MGLVVGVLFGQGRRGSWWQGKVGGDRGIVVARSWDDMVVSGRRGWSGRKHPNVRRGRVQMGGAAALFLTVSHPSQR